MWEAFFANKPWSFLARLHWSICGQRKQSQDSILSSQRTAVHPCSLLLQLLWEWAILPGSCLGSEKSLRTEAESCWYVCWRWVIFLLNSQSNELASDFSSSSSLNLQGLLKCSEERKAFFVLMWQNIYWPVMFILWLFVSLWFSNKGFYIHNKNMRGTILFTLLINYMSSTQFEIKMLF